MTVATLAPILAQGRVRTVAPGIHHVDTYPFNWYVVEEAGRLTLVDSGWPGHYDALVAGLAAIGKTPADIEAILISHAHADHVGMAGLLARKHRIPIFVHSADRAMLASVLQLPWYGLLSNAWRSHTAFAMLGHAIRNGIFSERAICNAYTFEDGDELDVPGRPRIIHIPGHTPGEVAFVMPARGVVLTGDTLVTEDLRTGIPGPPQFPHVSLNGDDRLARRSVDKLRELGAATLLPGHGRPWMGTLTEAIDGARHAR